MANGYLVKGISSAEERIRGNDRMVRIHKTRYYKNAADFLTAFLLRYKVACGEVNNRMKHNNQGEFLMSFFKGERYQELEVNGFWLVYHLNGRKWTVAVYTKESFEKYKNFNNLKEKYPILYKEIAEQDEHFKTL